MGSSWQRCAAGKWSEVRACAAGTECSPSGTSYDFHIVFAGKGTAVTASATRAAHGSMGVSGWGVVAMLLILLGGAW